MLQRDLILLPRNRVTGRNKVRFKMNEPCCLLLIPASWGSFHKDLGHCLRSPTSCHGPRAAISKYTNFKGNKNDSPLPLQSHNTSFLWPIKQVAWLIHGFLQTPSTAKMGTGRWSSHLIMQKVFPEGQVLILTCAILCSQEGPPFEQSYIFLSCKMEIKTRHALLSQDWMS